jgi:hypothetical protein
VFTSKVSPTIEVSGFCFSVRSQHLAHGLMLRTLKTAGTTSNKAMVKNPFLLLLMWALRQGQKGPRRRSGCRHQPSASGFSLSLPGGTGARANPSMARPAAQLNNEELRIRNGYKYLIMNDL